jgi:pSer/pThr/pTyr-binding forkhead associated (FHA) protein
MLTKLIVASGKSAGRSIAIKRNKLLIGRAEECDVRPLSEEVSRRHCAVHVGPAEAWVEDLGSRNGTFVNGTKITEKMRIKDGDIIRVGALELKVSCVDPAAKAGTEDDVSRWLMADDKPTGMFDTTQPVGSAGAQPATDDSSPGSFISGIGSPLPTAGTGDTTQTSSGTSAIGGLKTANKPAPGSLPTPAKRAADSSRDAAAEALKKFFEKR